ncbi:uncharacterized protein LOC130633797 isoform X2 [Hydractinia symbiolongicarpus]|uniref:uncharacterized protein LOC130633797 isoform X2 n=1 Tax=Hydractinia symbiolongicarpus TaxID=13093 RepID=UPI00254A0986|nr:uncharacterized protein LOC130633797 isoform X2 [Hydractinia symbiolongicarpus]
MIWLVLFIFFFNGICITNGFPVDMSSKELVNTNNTQSTSTTTPQIQEDSIKGNFMATSKFWGPILSALLLFIVGVFVNFRKLIVNFSDGYRKTYKKRYDDCHKIHSNWWSYLSFCGIGSSLRIFFSQFNSIWNICKKKNVKDRTVTVSSWSGIFKTCPKLSWKDVLEMMRSYDKYFLHHYNFCSYEECPHDDYKFCCGLMMEPVYYFVVVDWNSKNQGKYEIQNLTLEDNVALTVMDRDHRPPGYANLPNEQPNSELKKSLEDMKGQFKKICLVLLNFPTEISENHAAIKAIHNFITDYNVKLIYKSWVETSRDEVESSTDNVNDSLPLLEPGTHSHYETVKPSNEDYMKSKPRSSTHGKPKEYKPAHNKTNVGNMDPCKISSNGTVVVDETTPLEETPAKKRQSKDADFFNKPLDDLKFTELCKKLDSALPPCNVDAVARACDFTLEEMVQLQLHRAGGGSPALTFLRTLVLSEEGERSIEDLKECFKAKKIPKAALNVLKTFSDVDHICNLTEDQLDQLAQKLQFQPYVSLPDWKDVADYFNMHRLIPNCQQAVKQNNSYSPTFYLVQLLSTRGCTIGKFLEVLRKVNKQAVEMVEQQAKTA